MANDFKHQSVSYSEFRPSYPLGLFKWLGSIALPCDCAWDCATGNGQAALGLADYYREVLATDVNQSQLDRAPKHARVKYICAAAESCEFRTNSVDLVTVACAIHWFDRQSFYEQVRRVTRPGGVFIVWTYEWPWTGSDRVNELLMELKEEILGPYWPPEAHLYLTRYQNLDFPFDEINVPSFSSRFGESVEQGCSSTMM